MWDPGGGQTPDGGRRPNGWMDKTLKRRVAAKFAEGDVSGSVIELASAEGLALQDGNTLRMEILSKSTLRAQKTLGFPTHLMGL